MAKKYFSEWTQEAKTNLELHPLLKRRWSPRAYTEQAVEKEKLIRLFEAARWPPSASNEQPWSFIIGLKGENTYDKIFSTLVEFNQLWCKFAPVLVLSCARKNQVKREGENPYRMYDVGQSIAHLTFQASYEGLFVHQMAGFDIVKAKEILKVPDAFEVLTTFAIGYIGDPEILHPNLKRLEIEERTRQEQKKFVFSGKFGEPFVVEP